MTDAITRWWTALSLRERVLVGIAAAITAALVGWFLIYRPLTSALETERLAHFSAIERRAAVTARVAEIRRLQSAGTRTARPAGDSGGPLTLILTQAAAERGFSLSRNDAQGNDTATIAIANARTGALLAWIDEMAAQGYGAGEMTLRPNADGTVALTATMRRGR